jgi:adenine deaminase
LKVEEGVMTDGSQRAAMMDVALGRAAADLVLADAGLVNVLTREIYRADIAIKDGRIAATLPAGSALKGDRVENLAGLYVTPGFIDPHVHIESSLVTVTQYARAVVSHGVTMVAHDPHEIGNVLGLAGIQLMQEEAKHVPLRVRLRVPGRIPAYPAWLETSNSRIDLEETRDMLDWNDAVCLAGDFNPAWIIRQDPEQMAKIAMAIERDMTVSGQAAGIVGPALCAYVASGSEDTHVASSVAEILEDLRAGLRTVLVLRPGRRLGREHVAELCALIQERKLETRFIQLSTDDVYPNHLLHEGHIDHRVRLCIEEGFEPIMAYQMATLNVAEALRIDRDYGSVSPGKCADLLILDNLEEVSIRSVMIDGDYVYQDGSYTGPGERYEYPDWCKQSVSLQRPLLPEDFHIHVDPAATSAVVRAMITDAPKRQEEVELPVVNGVVQPSAQRGFSALAMVERHKRTGSIGKAFVGGLTLRRGAIASTVSHDAHNILTVGADFQDMATAVNRLAEIQGGYVIVVDGHVVFEVPLPIGGLMSEEPVEWMAQKIEEFEAILTNQLGCPPASQIMMRFNGLSLSNSASCGFSDKGLISSREMTLLDPVVRTIARPQTVEAAK